MQLDERLLCFASGRVCRLTLPPRILIMRSIRRRRKVPANRKSVMHIFEAIVGAVLRACSFTSASSALRRAASAAWRWRCASSSCAAYAKVVRYPRSSVFFPLLVSYFSRLHLSFATVLVVRTKYPDLRRSPSGRTLLHRVCPLWSGMRSHAHRRLALGERFCAGLNTARHALTGREPQNAGAACSRVFVGEGWQVVRDVRRRLLQRGHARHHLWRLQLIHSRLPKATVLTTESAAVLVPQY